MPVYQRQIDVPAGTARKNAETERVEIDERWIEEGLRFAAPGSNNTVNAELRFGEARLLPREGADTTVVPNSTTTEPIEERIVGQPAELEWRAWSPNATFDHTLTLKVVTRELERANPIERLIRTFTGRQPRVRRRGGQPEQLTAGDDD